MKTLCTVILTALSLATRADTTQNRNGFVGGHSQLEIEFNQQTANLDPQSKNTLRERWKILDNLLEKYGDEFRRNEIQSLAKITENEFSEFDDFLTQCLLDSFLRHAETNLVENLLEVHCPNYIGSSPTEYRLAQSWGRGGIRVLVRVFQGSSRASVKEMVAQVLSRAFPSLRNKFKSEADFIGACERWALTHPNDQVLNPNYPYFPGGPVRSADDPAYQAGLFVARMPTEGKK